MRKLILTSAILLLNMSFFSAKNTTEENQKGKVQNIQYQISFSKGTCTLYLWHTDALGNETHWTETYETSTQAECNQKLADRLKELDSSTDVQG